MKYNRSSGILLHPTSLPGPFGIGDLGPQAYIWLDFLKKCGCRLWQILPLGPTGYGDSPYQCFSAFAGNFYLISPELLLEDHLLLPEDLTDLPPFPQDRVDFGWVIPWKIKLLDLAHSRFVLNNGHEDQQYYQFIQENKEWLDDFALFMAIKEKVNGVSWTNWPESLRNRETGALQQFRAELNQNIDRQIFRQFIFSRQWNNLTTYAHQQGIRIIGDAPIFVAHDSADVWANPELFSLDPQGNPTVVAGVPPDYFSATGQLWGNPLYRWQIHKESGYRWWLARLRSVLSMVDYVRLDHFRGFAGYWEIPAGLPTAEKGRWVKGPGHDFFEYINQALGDLPIIAEDLGEITSDVIELRDHFSLPGMKILQFGFGTDASDKFLPHNYTRNFVGYTGTHDNDTCMGWYQNVPRQEVNNALRYLGIQRRSADIHFAEVMIRALWASVAMFSLAPMQDFLGLGTVARMNYPGNPSGNWTWRMGKNVLTAALSRRISDLNQIYGRS